MTRICYVSRIWQTDCKLFVCAKEKTRNKQRYFTWLTPEPCGSWNKAAETILNFRILKPVNCINWELKFSMKWTMSSLNIYFTSYRNAKFYYKSLKLSSFGTWFDGSRA